MNALWLSKHCPDSSREVATYRRPRHTHTQPRARSHIPNLARLPAFLHIRIRCRFLMTIRLFKHGKKAIESMGLRSAGDCYFCLYSASGGLFPTDMVVLQWPCGQTHGGGVDDRLEREWSPGWKNQDGDRNRRRNGWVFPGSHKRYYKWLQIRNIKWCVVFESLKRSTCNKLQPLW